jgi:hypothetical protein
MNIRHQILKKVLKFSLLNLVNDKRILNCGSLCREKQTELINSLTCCFLNTNRPVTFFSITMQPLRQPQYNNDSAARHKDH